ncbi:DUF1707 and DUF4870 domain-containing protein [Thermostaphylospora chromogena]|uniref:Uncharacterized conserved protein, Tic20 family n=1 Tax=Thermostaphylospora chromogena TaxID=35622 RepID=A0A1H1I3M8_9ACTN|nr:DUF1707 and DUF4870 domain-containing protein [Thermostaphylospora chromogena]SDR32242.1 Uncharacterized conserved protein, Tic20 family [Thermostaphylospora chromogena]
MAGMPHHPGPMQPPRPVPYEGLRIGNQEREQVIEHVKTAFEQGRLDKIEFDERVDRVMKARTHADLIPIMEELYGPASAHFAPAPPQPAGGLVSSNERLGAGAAHLLPLLGFPILGPLIVMLASGKTAPFARSHAVEALNFQLTVLGASIVLSITLVGLVLLPMVLIAALVLGIVAGVKGIEGKPYRYPLTVRLVK